ncbi:glycosyltransferase family 4 protein [Weissella confusa]|uniref:Glycosyltransferase n=1 Tax=Weissella fermenti TaxID=2987699 RepID=A0ABT6D0Y7_9LACO|nr:MULTISPECIES: glycosyltransferase [Weissella]MBJ7689115.1 glycosyltransferase family 4 protein [Weissella confusa]MDF9299128.1 glycosyltransferase [Weissella sp. BK2]
MKEKVLLLAAKANMIQQFNMRNIKLLQKLGKEVHVATNFKDGGSIDQAGVNELVKELENMSVICHQIDFGRGFGSVAGNYIAVKQLLSILNKKEEWAFIHAHSPLGGVLGRIAGKLTGVKSIYTAHGFHFFVKGPLKNWLIFPVEWVFAKMTSRLVVVNQNDYKISKWLPVSKVTYLPSIGSDVTSKLNQDEHEKANKREIFRREMKFNDDDFVFLSVGELNDNKNHAIVVEALKRLPAQVKYIIAGIGENKSKLEEQIIKNGLTNRVKLLGYRSDLSTVYAGADAFVFPSKREGFGIGGFDALLSGLYVIGTKNTNMKDYIVSDDLGVLVNTSSEPAIVGAMAKVYNNRQSPNLSQWSGYLNQFDETNVDKIMNEVYIQELK